MYVNNAKVDESLNAQKVPSGEYNRSGSFYVGRADTDMTRENYANVVVDDLELYEARRDWLIPSMINPGMCIPSPNSTNETFQFFF